MSIRAVVLGLAIGLAISALTYLNDFVANQTLLIGNFLPISVFGFATFLVLAANPLLRLAGTRAPLRAGELAIAVAIALSACAYPGANFYRYFTAVTSMPPVLARQQSSWQSTEAMSYLPGGSPRIAPGHVKDWPRLLRAMDEQRDAADPGPAGRIYRLAGDEQKHLWDQAIEAGAIERRSIGQYVRAINDALGRAEFSDAATESMTTRQRVAANRQFVVEAMPEVFLPRPRGDHVLVTGEVVDTQVIEPLSLGLATGELLPVDRVPWAAWWPTLRLWGGAALLLGLASLCLALIVHPQWSHRELLQYPIPRFLELMTHRAPGRSLPDIARSPGFWVAFAVVAGLHLNNGLHAWVTQWPSIPTNLTLWPLRSLFPNASQVALSAYLFNPRMFPTVIALGYLLNRSVSLSLGTSHLLFVSVGAVFVANGAMMEYDKFQPNKMNLLRMGAFVGLTLMILYTGRRYYLDVVRGALGGKTDAITPRYSVWAARLMALLLAAAIALLTTSGMSLLIATVLVGLVLMIWLVLTRVVAETGMILMAGPFLPLGVLPWLMGYEALGPTHIIVLAIGGFLLIGDPKESLMPFVINGLKMTDQSKARPGRVAWVMVGMIVVGFIVATVITMSLQYEHGLAFRDRYGTQRVPAVGFTDAARASTELLSRGQLVSSVQMNDLQRLAALDPEPAGLAWMGLGIALILGTALARLRLPWWPIHPVIWIVFGTWAIGQLHLSFFLGWLAHTVAIRSGGVRTYRAGMPIAAGMIAGELSAGLMWMVVAWVYFLATGQDPMRYYIFP